MSKVWLLNRYPFKLAFLSKKQSFPITHSIAFRPLINQEISSQSCDQQQRADSHAWQFITKINNKHFPFTWLFKIEPHFTKVHFSEDWFLNK